MVGVGLSLALASSVMPLGHGDPGSPSADSAAPPPGRITPGLGSWTAQAASRYWTAARMTDDTGETGDSQDGAQGSHGTRTASGGIAGSTPFDGIPVVGRLFMTGTNVGDSGISSDAGECTASVVHSPGRNLIVTAAHCLDNPDRHGHYAFVPQYHQGQKPFGAFPVNLKRTWIDPRYLKLGHVDGAPYDIGFAEVGPGLDGRNVENVVGANTMDFNAGHTDHQVQLVGYSVYEGRARSCTGTAVPFQDDFLRIGCAGYDDGTSGSPWMAGFNGRTGKIIGVIGGWETGGSNPDTSYAAYVGDAAEAVYRQATAGKDPVTLPS
ncbi:hypothetical protein BIV57_06875 [Mangrovactinospora gilvigrisea]|uniref:Peptidase S1 domain-containing protein n=1 Tax=Mangrovactinospora gilvigrisea TaxID=1428644 RepID=A0A1J7C9Q9_9ACTN|nr:hypothetical protein BIV57_06875 [Mangrovactinospora gilvigrisea]